MNHIGNIEKHVNALKDEVEKLTEYRTTYDAVLPEIANLLDKLFEEPSIKALSNYVHLNNIYYQPIKDMINPGSFKQIVRETQLPGIYDPPSMRNKRIPGANSKKKTSPKKKTTKIETENTNETSSIIKTTTDNALESNQDENSYYSIIVDDNIYYYETNTHIVYDEYKQNVGKINSDGMHINTNEYKFKEVHVHERDDDFISIDGEASYNKILDDNLNIGIICI